MLVAEELNFIVVSSDMFRNTGAVWNEEDEAMLACFKELLPVLEKSVPHDPMQLYLGGSSGGAQAAFHDCTKVDRPWAGIFSNGGWIGGPEYYHLPFPPMRIAMVNGHQDPANSRAATKLRLPEIMNGTLRSVYFCDFNDEKAL